MLKPKDSKDGLSSHERIRRLQNLHLATRKSEVTMVDQLKANHMIQLKSENNIQNQINKRFMSTDK